MLLLRRCCAAAALMADFFNRAAAVGCRCFAVACSTTRLPLLHMSTTTILPCCTCHPAVPQMLHLQAPVSSPEAPAVFDSGAVQGLVQLERLSLGSFAGAGGWGVGCA